mmetsp:Transcript_9149/g.37479  ORF Transcript_9149/g.37479 Transcript_9149/m.37479 type:complete len:232 (-) Transcript_9149:344-1039(-)
MAFGLPASSHAEWRATSSAHEAWTRSCSTAKSAGSSARSGTTAPPKLPSMSSKLASSSATRATGRSRATTIAAARRWLTVQPTSPALFTPSDTSAEAPAAAASSSAAAASRASKAGTRNTFPWRASRRASAPDERSPSSEMSSAGMSRPLPSAEALAAFSASSDTPSPGARMGPHAAATAAATESAPPSSASLGPPAAGMIADAVPGRMGVRLASSARTACAPRASSLAAA